MYLREKTVKVLQFAVCKTHILGTKSEFPIDEGFNSSHTGGLLSQNRLYILMTLFYHDVGDLGAPGQSGGLILVT